jgi:hypothetical protein
MTPLMDMADAFLRRCWLTWRFIYALHYSPRIAWSKSRRPQ